jgi:DNA-binding GntR family transcriptional regulator
MSVAEATEIYEVRAALEALAGEGFALRANAAERAALRAVYEELCQASAAGPRQALLDIKQRFYEILSRGSRNSYAARMLDRLLSRNAQLRAMSLSRADRLPQTIAEIGDIMSAIERRDAVAAGLACRQHVLRAAEVALRILQEQQISG